MNKMTIDDRLGHTNESLDRLQRRVESIDQRLNKEDAERNRTTGRNILLAGTLLGAFAAIAVHTAVRMDGNYTNFEQLLYAGGTLFVCALVSSIWLLIYRQ